MLGIFCGHLHLTFASARLGEFPVYQTGAFCGDGGCDPPDRMTMARRRAFDSSR